jgi:prephenate dehydratase
MALAQCEKFFLAHPNLKRVPAEDTAGSVRDVISRGDKSAAGIAGRRAAEHYHGVILAERIQDNAENFTRFVLLIPVVREGSGESENSARVLSPAVTDLMLEVRARQMGQLVSGSSLKMSVALRLAHKPGALLAALEPFARHGINLMKIESRPIHGTPWVYQFFLDLLAESPTPLHAALSEVDRATSFLRILGLYPVAKQDSPSK